MSGVPEKLWIAPKEKLLELMVHRYLCFGWAIVLDYLLYREEVLSRTP